MQKVLKYRISTVEQEIFLCSSPGSVHNVWQTLDGGREFRGGGYKNQDVNLGNALDPVANLLGHWFFTDRPYNLFLPPDSIKYSCFTVELTVELSKILF